MMMMKMKMTFVSDSAYTERFMGLPTPEDNWQGYQEAALTRLKDNEKSAKVNLGCFINYN